MTRPLKGSCFWQTYKVSVKSDINDSGTRSRSGTMAGLRKNQSPIAALLHHNYNR